MGESKLLHSLSFCKTSSNFFTTSTLLVFNSFSSLLWISAAEQTSSIRLEERSLTAPRYTSETCLNVVNVFPSCKWSICLSIFRISVKSSLWILLAWIVALTSLTIVENYLRRSAAHLSSYRFSWSSPYFRILFSNSANWT